MPGQMEQKMQAANTGVTQLTNPFEQSQHIHMQKDNETRNELAAMRNEQAFAKQKISKVEASVVPRGQTVISTMQQMTAQVQQSLELSMKCYTSKGQSEECKKT